jgi:hypothetical protein
MRKNYFNPADPFLLEPAMARSPFAQFDRWFKALLAATEETGGGGSGCGEEVNAVALATCRYTQFI